jgi:tetratricopeptide (TPR) repeat protein
MALLHHKGIIIPLPPDWVRASDPRPIATGPSLAGQFVPNLVVTCEEIPPFETVDTFARRSLNSLQSALADFKLVEQASVAHVYLSVHRLEYEFDGSKDPPLRVRQLQHYVLVDQEIYTFTLSHLKEQFEDLKGFARVMIARLRIASPARHAGRALAAIETASDNEDSCETPKGDARDERAALIEIAALCQQKRFDQAEKALSVALARSPESASLLAERGSFFGRLGHYDKALDAFDEALARDPGNERAMTRKIGILRLQERFQQAGVVLTAALGQLPESADLLAQRDALFDAIEMKVTALRLQKRFQEADDMLAAALAGLALSERGALFCDLGQYDDAIDVLNRALEVDASVWRALALGLRLQGNLDEAEGLLSDALVRWPEAAPLLAERGALMCALGKYEEALDALDEALKHDASDKRNLQMKTAALRGQVERGIKHLYSQRYDEAIVALDAALRHDGGNEEALQLKVTVLRVQERFNEAEETLRVGLSRRPESARLLVERGALSFDLQQYGKALEALDKVLNRNESHESAREMKSAVLRLQGRFQEADEVLPPALTGLPLAERAAFLGAQRLDDKALDEFDKTPRAIALKISSLRTRRRFEEAEKMLSDALAEAEEKMLSDALAAESDIAPLLSERSKLFFDRGQYDDAMSACDLALKRDASDEEALQLKITALRMQERYKEAAKELTAAERKRPWSVILLAERGALFFDRGEYDKANGVFDDILERNRRDDFAHRLKAASLDQEGHADEAEKLLQLCIALCDVKHNALWQLGSLYLSQSQGSKALVSFERAASFDPHSVSPIAGKALALRKLGRISEAESVLAEAESRFQEYSEPLSQIVWAHISGGDLKTARRILNTQKESRTETYDANWLRVEGLLLHLEGNASEASETLRRLLKQLPHDAAAKAILVLALLQLRYSHTETDAEKLCKQLLSSNPRNPTAIASLGVIALRRREIRQSERLLRAAMSLDRYSNASIHLASLLVYLGDYDEAKDLLTSNIKSDPEDALSHFELGKLYYEMKNSGESIRYLRRALSIDPSNTGATRALALALMQQGEYPKASKILKDGIKRTNDSDRHQLYITLAQLMLRNAENTEEQSLYSEALANVNAAINLNAVAADAYFFQGFIHYKLENSPGAIKSFKKYIDLTEKELDADIRRAEAERNLATLKKLRNKERVQSTGAVSLASMAAILLLGAVILFLMARISESSMLVLIPMSIALLVIAFMLPHLSKLKVFGLEAELSKPIQTISSAPSGAVIMDLSMDIRRPSLADGPR